MGQISTVANRQVFEKQIPNADSRRQAIQSQLNQTTAQRQLAYGGNSSNAQL
jgi:hypothetical protein